MIEIIPNWHPIFVHFTIGLLGTAVLFFLLSILLPVSVGLKTNWQIVARWCLWSGMAVTLLTVLAGYFAYNTVAHDSASHAAMTKHRNWAFATVGAFVIVTLWSIWLHLKKQAPGLVFLVIALTSGVLLASTGWHGGEAVYRYGIGVMSLPKTVNGNSGGHTHDHPDGGHGANSNQFNRTDLSPGQEHNHEHSSNDVDNSIVNDGASSAKPELTEMNQQENGNEGHVHHNEQPHSH